MGELVDFTDVVAEVLLDVHDLGFHQWALQELHVHVVEGNSQVTDTRGEVVETLLGGGCIFGHNGFTEPETAFHPVGWDNVNKDRVEPVRFHCLQCEGGFFPSLVVHLRCEPWYVSEFPGVPCLKDALSRPPIGERDHLLFLDEFVGNNATDKFLLFGQETCSLVFQLQLCQLLFGCLHAFQGGVFEAVVVHQPGGVTKVADSTVERHVVRLDGVQCCGDTFPFPTLNAVQQVTVTDAACLEVGTGEIQHLFNAHHIETWKGKGAVTNTLHCLGEINRPNARPFLGDHDVELCGVVPGVAESLPCAPPCEHHIFGSYFPGTESLRFVGCGDPATERVLTLGRVEAGQQQIHGRLEVAGFHCGAK